MTGESYDTSRRDLLAAMAAGGVAGCSGDGQNTPEGGENTPTDNIGTELEPEETNTPAQTTSSNTGNQPNTEELYSKLISSKAAKDVDGVNIHEAGTSGVTKTKQILDSLTDKTVDEVDEKIENYVPKTQIPGIGFLSNPSIRDEARTASQNLNSGWFQYNGSGEELWERIQQNPDLDTQEVEQESGWKIFSSGWETLNTPAEATIGVDVQTGELIYALEVENNYKLTNEEAAISLNRKTAEGELDSALQDPNIYGKIVRNVKEEMEGDQIYFNHDIGEIGNEVAVVNYGGSEATAERFYIEIEDGEVNITEDPDIFDIPNSSVIAQYLAETHTLEFG
jgi:hypothetical protein